MPALKTSDLEYHEEWGHKVNHTLQSYRTPTVDAVMRLFSALGLCLLSQNIGV